MVYGKTHRFPSIFPMARLAKTQVFDYAQREVGWRAVSHDDPMIFTVLKMVILHDITMNSGMFTTDQLVIRIS